MSRCVFCTERENSEKRRELFAGDQSDLRRAAEVCVGAGIRSMRELDSIEARPAVINVGVEF